MGLGPIQAIYQAHVMKYQQSRGLVDHGDRKIWCFMGDGECDEPESLGAISLAGREQLIQQAWGADTHIGDRVVDTHILNLRKKIEPAPARPQFLHSVRGIGYRFDG